MPSSNYLSLLFFTFFCFHIRSITLNAFFHQSNKPSGLVLLQKASQQLLLAPLRGTVQRHSPKERAHSITLRSSFSFFGTVQLGPLFSSSVQGSSSTEMFLRLSREDKTLFYSSFCSNKSKINCHHFFFLIWYHDWSYR